MDTPGNSSTTASIGVGGTVSDTLETLGDHDWFRITLTAGQSITVFVDGISLEDPYVYIRDSSGTLLFENDDIILGTNRDSRVSFTAPSSGTYFIDVGAFDEAYTGTYQVSVSVYTPPPLASLDQIADQLVEGFWAGDDHHFAVSQGGSITVNITALTPAGQNLAREALMLWGDAIGVQFVEVGGPAQIQFDDNQEGAFSDSNWSGGIISSSTVNVANEWLLQYGTGLNSYSFQTYVHEIGHALGLGHAGNYNGSASYPFDASFENDAWVTSIMSYFSQTENTYFGGQGFTENFVVTPMLADLIAMNTLYGLSTTTRTGNTTYGFNSNSGRAVYDANQLPSATYTIFDSGGTDTLDYSGYNTNQLINLNAETFSNVGSEIGNVSIARGVVIENAIGGSGWDTLTGNSVANVLTGNGGNDLLIGNGGVDTLIGGLGNDRFFADQGDVIVELVGGGDDWLLATTSYVLAAGVAVETLSTVNGDGAQALNLTGNAFSQSIYGNNGANILSGGGGTDYLAGQAGNDRYFVDQDDAVAEAAGGGEDWVLASTNHVLSAGAAVETFSTVNGDGTQAINLTGNAFSQSIYGNNGANILSGGGGADYLAGQGGNDRYFVDQDDVVAEAAGGGEDWVLASTSHVLSAGAAVETFSTVNGDGTQAIDLTGNEFGQSIYGNAGANILSGGGGADYLNGGLGNDRYFVDQDDVVAEAAGGGADWVLASTSHALSAGAAIETFSTVNGDGTQAINLTGNAFGQDIYGNAGANILSGGGGTDTLVGGGGSDVFVLSGLALSGPGNIATIADYAAGEVVDITQILAVANGTDVTAGGYLKVTSSGQLQVDVNGGGDNFVTVGNVSGSGAVTIRYLAGGSATDLSVARSASQSASMSMAIAAAGLVKIAPETDPVDTQITGLADPSHIDGNVELGQAQVAIAENTADGLDSGALAPMTSAISDGPVLRASLLSPEHDVMPVLDSARAAAPAELLAPSDAPVHATYASPLAAPAVAMPAAEQLAQLAAGTGEASQHEQLVSEVLLEALHGGEAGSPIVDALIAALPVSATEAVIEHAAWAADGWQLASASPHPILALEAMAVHPDALPAA